MDFTTFIQLARWCKQAVSQDRLHLAILSKPHPGSPDMHGFKQVYDFWRAHQPGMTESSTRSDRLSPDQAHLDSFLTADQIVLITHAQGIVAVGTLHFLDLESLTDRRSVIATSVDIDGTLDTICKCIRVLHGTQLVVTPFLDSFMASAAKIDDLYMSTLRKLVESDLPMLLGKMSAKTRNYSDAKTAGGETTCRHRQGRRPHNHKIEVITDLAQRRAPSSCEVVPTGFERLWERRSGSWSRIIGIESVAHL